MTFCDAERGGLARRDAEAVDRDLAHARQHRDAGVAAARAGAADRDDHVGLLVGERAFERAHEDHVRAMRRDAARESPAPTASQPGIATTRTRGSRTVHARDPDGLQRRDIDRAQPLAGEPQRTSGTASAPAASTPSPAVATHAPRASAPRHGVRRQHGVGVARHRGARIDPRGRGSSSIGA